MPHPAWCDHWRVLSVNALKSRFLFRGANDAGKTVLFKAVIGSVPSTGRISSGRRPRVSGTSLKSWTSFDDMPITVLTIFATA
jgi:ABC-type branched-subunit amino acid transport system ATPase component